MSAQTSPDPPQAQISRLVGGRFEIQAHHGSGPWGAVLRARDVATGGALAIRQLGGALAGSADAVKHVEQRVEAAVGLEQRNILRTHGIIVEAERGPFLASEWPDGSSLLDFVRVRRHGDRKLSARGAYNVLAHVCRALSYAHATTCHGLLRPAVVWVSASGRIRIDEFGVSLAAAELGAWKSLDPAEQKFLAPEIREGGPVDARSDVFGAGALLHVLLTGRAPAEPTQRLSEAHPALGEELESVLARCLEPEPARRFSAVSDIAEALRPLALASVQSGEGLGAEIEIDVRMESRPPAPMVIDSKPPGPQGRTEAARRANGRAGAPAGSRAAKRPAESAETALATALATIERNDATRWMLAKDGVDHGPFSGRELVDLILSGDALAEHGLLNMDTRERKSLAEFKDFGEFVAQYEFRRKKASEQRAIERSQKAERRTNTAKYLVLAGAAGALALGILGYFASRPDDKPGQRMAAADLAALYESGQVKVRSKAGILPRSGSRSKRSASRKNSRRSSAKGSPSALANAGGLSYEQAMMQPVRLDVVKSGGERQLPRATIQTVMDRRLNSLFGCVGKELRRGGRLATVTIDMAVLGTGAVQGVSVRGKGSSSFKGCVAAKVRKVQFPTFPAARMGARYAFDVD
ncbi:MAG: protein kinase [Proteobacteria bacterium]|nr:protein kinase [Pseudomonadota bacterium]